MLCPNQCAILASFSPPRSGYRLMEYFTDAPNFQLCSKQPRDPGFIGNMCVKFKIHLKNQTKFSLSQPLTTICDWKYPRKVRIQVMSTEIVKIGRIEYRSIIK